MYNIFIILFFTLEKYNKNFIYGYIKSYNKQTY